MERADGKRLGYASYEDFYTRARRDVDRVYDGYNPIVKGMSAVEFKIALFQALRDYSAGSFFSGKPELEAPVLDVIIRQYKEQGGLAQTWPCREEVWKWLVLEDAAQGPNRYFTLTYFDMLAGRDREADEPKHAFDPYELDEWVKRADPEFSRMVERYALAVNAVVNDVAAEWYGGGRA
ncbi:MAG: hypothetical protein Q4E01_00150 [Actinomycetaceae bacterium]|nr:hypothetical protein [Actinomycetaceae bacterium]